MRPYRKSDTFTYTQLWPQSVESLSLLEDVSLSYLDFLYYIYHDQDMLTTLMEWWYPNSNTVHLPTREIIVTLKDLYRITRLPIRGKLGNMTLVPSMEQAKKWDIWLTGLDEVNHKKKGVFLMRHVLEDAPTWYDLWLRFLIAYLLDAIIYPNKSNETFLVGMVSIIIDMIL